MAERFGNGRDLGIASGFLSCRRHVFGEFFGNRVRGSSSEWCACWLK
jgi:hypothetical protein